MLVMFLNLVSLLNLAVYTFFFSGLPSPAGGGGGGALDDEETEAVRGLPEVSTATGPLSVVSSETTAVVVVVGGGRESWERSGVVCWLCT